MRRGAVLAIVIACGAAGSAAAQGHASDAAAAALLDREVFQPGEGPVRWRSGELQLFQGDGAVDSLRVGVGGRLTGEGGGPLLDLRRAAVEPDAFDVTLVRSWPSALRFDAGDLDVDFSPHAGVGVSSLGGQAEAGAKVEIGPKSREQQAIERLRDMGVKDGAAFGDQGRWYIFAAASGRAVGLNMLRNDRGWDRAGWSTDPAGALVGDAHVGVGWRKGDFQTSFGVIHREVKGQHMVFGQHTREDTVAAFSFSIRPQR